MPFRKIFVSRWSALFWAAGILWTAVDTVGFAPAHHAGQAKPVASITDATGSAVSPQDLATLANALQNE
ncbi:MULTISPECIES: hypothetical protein [unclassified Sphingomonas]|uniref:hypothetical protein n=1 Tax=unclassified Sphingomonas TaxID=196159 RepID=UPI001F58211C|nr:MULTISPECIES: hypothetical protein [unclassified Sphingomonas]